MSPKQFVKEFNKLLNHHQENIQYWKEASREVIKTVESLINHREQLEMISKLHTNHLEIQKVFPDIKVNILYKLFSICQDTEAKLIQYLATFSSQTEKIKQLSSECAAISKNLPIADLITVKPEKMCLAHQLELADNLSLLYNSVYLGIKTWLECMHTDKNVWNVGTQLEKIIFFHFLT